jgi:hypothetical protein
MGIKTIPLSRLEADPKGTLNECADSGQAILIELPDRRLLALQPLEPGDEDRLIDDLLESNEAFQVMVASSKAGVRKPFADGAPPH